jgi:hypothetical protein
VTSALPLPIVAGSKEKLRPGAKGPPRRLVFRERSTLDNCCRIAFAGEHLAGWGLRCGQDDARGGNGARESRGAVVYDAEDVGLMLWRWLEADDDFQDLPSWRSRLLCRCVNTTRTC